MMIEDRIRIWNSYTRILSDMDINVVYDDTAKTAKFYPRTTGEQARVVLPTFIFLNDDATQLLVSHEVGHALFSKYTKAEMKKYYDKYGSLFNVIEDAYIEKKIQVNYPGLKSIFSNGYATLYHNDFFGKLTYDIINTSSLTSRLNLYAKLYQFFPDIQFDREECNFVIRMTQLSSNKDVIDLCNDILAYLRNKPASFDEKQARIDSKELKSDDMNTASDFGEKELRNDSYAINDDTNESDDIRKELIDIIGNIYEEKLNEYGSKHINKTNRHDAIPVLSSNDDVLGNLTKYQKQLESNFYNNVNDEELVNLIKSLARSADLIFKQKKSASEIRNARMKSVGKLDMKRISRYNTTGNIFRYNKKEYEGKNHGIVILIDCSNSMANNIEHVLIQAAVLGEFCMMNNIPFEIIAFGMYISLTGRNASDIENYNKLCYKIADSLHFSIQAILGLQKCDIEIRDYFYINRWNTPLVEGLIAASNAIDKFKKHDIEKTSLYIITDGMHDNKSADNQNSYESVSKMIYDDVLYDIEHCIHTDIIHKDWIVELLTYRIKMLYGTYISVQFLESFNFVVNSRISNALQRRFKIKESDCSGVYDEFFYVAKHLYYFPQKFDWKNTSAMVSCNFESNPFLDQFQTFDIDTYNHSSTPMRGNVHKSLLTSILKKYKLYKVMVSNYIGVIS